MCGMVMGRIALILDRTKWVLQCPYVWLSDVDDSYSKDPAMAGRKHVHICRRLKFHTGPHRDRLGLEQARKNSHKLY